MNDIVNAIYGNAHLLGLVEWLSCFEAEVMVYTICPLREG